MAIEIGKELLQKSGADALATITVINRKYSAKT